MSGIEQLLRVDDQPLEPRELVVELRPRLRIAVRQVQTADQQAIDGGLDIAAMRIVGIAGQTTAGFDRLGVLRENRDAVPRRLSMPDRTIAGAIDFGLGEA